MKSIYDSAFHHPFVAYLVGLVLLFDIARRLPFLYGYLFVFLVEILADACATGGWSPVPLGTSAYTVFSVLFIVLGDFRYFYFAERATRLDKPFKGPLLFATAVSVIVPVVTAIMTRTIPAMQNDRILYLVYEPALGLIVLGLDRFRYARSTAPAEIKQWVHRVSVLFATGYFGWAFCDALILAGIEFGHVLRIIPNLFYYGAFLPFIFWTAPASMRELRFQTPAQASS